MKITLRILVAIVTLALSQPVLAQDSPTVSFYSLLKGVSVNTNSNELMIDRISLAFLPDSPGEITVSVFQGETELATYPTMSVTTGRPFASYLVNSSGQEIALEVGSYRLEFNYDGETFYRFPFDVRFVEGGDRYNPLRLAMLDGYWQEYGGVKVPAPDQQVIWRELHRNEDLAERQVNGTRRINVYRNGSLFATSEEDTSSKIGVPVTGYHTWYISEPRLHRVLGGGETTILYGRDLTECGACTYQIEVDHLDAYLYEEPSMNDGPQTTPNVTQTDRYTLRVEGGEIVRSGNQDYTTTNPLDLIEGGPTMYWLQKSVETASR